MRARPITQPAGQLLLGRLQLPPASSPFQHALIRPQQSRWRSVRKKTKAAEGSAASAANEPSAGAIAIAPAEATSQAIPPEAAPTKSSRAVAPSKKEPKDAEESKPRLPRAVQALYLQPLRREVEYGVPTCDLQMRAFNPRPLEFFCDFALRAAYYLQLPAFGPVPLPKITERWTVPRSHFIFKKSQENFERITLRRMIQIRDGHPDAVRIWLAFLQKHAYPGIGMKANMWEFGDLDVAKEMDEAAKAAAEALEPRWAHLAQVEGSSKEGVVQMEELIQNERMRLTGGR